MQLVIASNNAKKRQEIANILAGLDIEMIAVEDTVFVDVIEDADSFSANARKKAEAFALANNKPALADDSGLCVDALDGNPGIYSSRFAGENASDADNNSKLLAELAGTENRKAHFMCALHLSFPDLQEAKIAQGTVDGMIVSELTGVKGFGYDPLFFCPELGKTFAEASSQEKASVSHRGRALQTLNRALKEQLHA